MSAGSVDCVATRPSGGAAATAKATPVRRLLVFHVGSLGDTLVALPVFWSIAEAYPLAHRVMLTKAAARGTIPVGRAILDGSGLFDDYLTFTGDHHAYGHNLPAWKKWLGAARLAARLRAERFDLVVYLAPSAREQAQTERDLLFFRLAGIGRVIGAGMPPEQGVHTAQREAERLLGRLQGSPIAVPALEVARKDLALNAHDRRTMDLWLSTLPAVAVAQGPWVAFAPGSNLQAKLWPAERFEAVGRALITRYNILPVIVGGAEDVEVGEQLVQAWGRGLNACGRLPVRQSAALLERCALFVGNDTGTMHLAAACGRPCVALFSARDEAGKWEPLGRHHQVLRKDVPCAGCMRVRCDALDRLCLRLIAVDEVLAAVARVLDGELVEAAP